MLKASGGYKLAASLTTCFLAGLLSGCVTSIPVDEYTLSRAAYDSAKEWQADQYASALWFNAETAYREAQKAFKERRYQDAQFLFVKAKNLAEQAENAARLARHQSGVAIP